MRFINQQVIVPFLKRVPKQLQARVASFGNISPRRQLHLVLGSIAFIFFVLGFMPPSKHKNNLAVHASSENFNTNDSAQHPDNTVSEIAATQKGLQNTPVPNTLADAASSSLKKNVFTSQPSDQISFATNIKNKLEIIEREKILNPNIKPPIFTYQTVKIQKADTLAKIFKRQGLTGENVNKILLASKKNPKLTTLQVGQTVKLQLADKQLIGLTLETAPGNTIILAEKNKSFEIEEKQVPTEKKLAFKKGVIQTSLSSSVKKLGLDSKVVAQMVDIFGGYLDFSSLRSKDSFRILFEEKFLNGQRVQTGHIIAAEIINKGVKHQAVHYTDKSGKSGYFSPEGHGLRQAFLRSPVNFTSISSKFGKRKHPVYHSMRQHRGVDFAAPKGAPVQATADAKVTFVGRKGGYGNVIELHHGNRYSTLYAHLSKFAKNLKVGTQVQQGQVIGFVGRTGLATGNHLHYEFRIDGVHKDPMSVSLPRKNPIQDGNKSHFLAHAKEMLRLLDMHDNKIDVASNDYLEND